MQIRKTKTEDLPELLRIYAAARQFMAAHGNPTQWGSTTPPKEWLEEDIAEGRSYVCVDEADTILCTFMFRVGWADPTYTVIENGAWLNDAPYGVVHRMASARRVPGAAEFSLRWCYEQCGRNLRVDTHADNLPMQSLFRKLGMHECGIIYIEDGTPRLAFHKCGETD